jgi:hypothetical protein
MRTFLATHWKVIAALIILVLLALLTMTPSNATPAPAPARVSAQSFYNPTQFVALQHPRHNYFGWEFARA